MPSELPRARSVISKITRHYEWKKGKKVLTSTMRAYFHPNGKYKLTVDYDHADQSCCRAEYNRQGQKIVMIRDTGWDRWYYNSKGQTELAETCNDKGGNVRLFTYDSHGRPLTETKYDQTGFPVSHRRFEYRKTAHGSMVTRHYSVNSLEGDRVNTQSPWKTTLTYSRLHGIADQRSFYNGKLVSRFTCMYDKEGRMAVIRHIKIESGKKVVTVDKYDYDEQGQETGFRRYVNGRLHNIRQNLYDYKGRTLSAWNMCKGVWYRKYDYVYNSEGDMVKIVWYAGNRRWMEQDIEPKYSANRFRVPKKKNEGIQHLPKHWWKIVVPGF